MTTAECKPTRKPAPKESLRDADEATILAFAATVVGTRPCEYGVAYRGGPKGEYGCLIEMVFGLDCNNKPEPDFRKARIELKSTKLERIGDAWKVGERTSLHKINFNTLPAETWAAATVKAKLGRILFCFYRWVPTTSPGSWFVDQMFFWEPDDLQWQYIEADWRAIQRLCKDGRPQDLSESLTRVLGAATKSAGGAGRRYAAGGPPPPRVFSLKQPFVRALYEIATGKPKLESLSRVLGITRIDRFEGVLLRQLDPYVRRSIAELARETNTPPTHAKHYSSIVLRNVIKKLLGVTNTKARIREFVEFGIEMHVVPMRASTGWPTEALSFPAFSYRGLLKEEWESSDLRTRLNEIFFVPIWRMAPNDPRRAWRLGRPFFWKPSAEELEGIHKDWESFRRQISAGRADQLTPASRTNFIHVRPHGRNSSDTDDAPGVGPLVKRSFWLNPSLVSRLVLAHDREMARKIGMSAKSKPRKPR